MRAVVQVEAEDGDLEERERLTRLLRNELLAADVDDVEYARDGHAPDGAKGSVDSVGGLVVALADSAVLSAALTGLTQIVRGWITRGRGRRVSITIDDHVLELSDAEPAQQQQLVDAFITAVRQDRQN
ncbi:hypothetical protein L1857_12685 [Amycolatopsis thermalba]|uniref:Uncharacterized protein n=1 Tax=Amycolatopsis thermalba TaxID=944492 RepID=A0ABY4NUB3_9PSEU|nr:MULTISPECIES: hypothetical protein [Amycolatopsis]UQS23621.1 hypothetical protein L1857_12685 [Amycolatopsis thermalba]